MQFSIALFPLGEVMDSEADECLLLLALALSVKRRKRRKRRTIWMKECLKKRDNFTHENLLNELRLTSNNEYENFLRVDAETFDEILQMVSPKIQRKDTMMRQAISASQRLAVTLHYLATGNSFEDLRSKYSISSQSIGYIIIETCEAIITTLRDYIKVPQSEQEWKKIATEFYSVWNFPNCLGAIDGKHIAIIKPANSGSLYYNYKNSFSIVLMTVVNANYEFMAADMGTNGRISDGDVILNNTPFGRALENNTLGIPEPSILPASERTLPYVFIGDNTFQMQGNLITPYARKCLTNKQRIFNYRLSRARGIAENAFGILVSRFGVLKRLVTLAPEKAQTVVLACCYLHNYLRKKIQRNYVPTGLVDNEDTNTGTLRSGSWRQNIQLTSLNTQESKRLSVRAKALRDSYADYFFNEGQVPWQHKYPV